MKRRIARKVIGAALAGRAACYKTHTVQRASTRITRACFAFLSQAFDPRTLHPRHGLTRREMIEDYAVEIGRWGRPTSQGQRQSRSDNG